MRGVPIVKINMHIFKKTSLNIIDVLVSLDYFAICGPFAVRAIIPCLQPSNLLLGHYLAVTGYTAS